MPPIAENAQRAVTVTFPTGSFTEPGVYRYVIQETAGSAPGVTYDTAARYLDVLVIADANDALSVQGYVLRNSAGAINSDYTYDDQDKSEGFTNTIEQYDFNFSKEIEGNQGDKNKQFTFTLGITNAIPGTYPIVIDGHHMEYGAMYGALDEYIDESYFDAHRTGTLVTIGGGSYTIELFASCKADATESLIFDPPKSTNRELFNYLETHAAIYEPQRVMESSRILALSTCQSADTIERMIVFGVLE